MNIALPTARRHHMYFKYSDEYIYSDIDDFHEYMRENIVFNRQINMITRMLQGDRFVRDPAYFYNTMARRQEGRIHLSYGCEGFLGEYEGFVRDHMFTCQAGMSISSVMIDGSISACASIRSNLAQGNIYKDDFIDVWENRYQPYRDRSWMKTGECADCKYFRYCQGNGMHLRDDNGELILCHLKRLK